MADEAELAPWSSKVLDIYSAKKLRRILRQIRQVSLVPGNLLTTHPLGTQCCELG